MDQNTGRSAPPLRKTGLKSLPSLPQPPAAPGITFSRFGLLLGGAVVVAALGWAFFMGFMVGRGDNPSEQVAEATSFLRDGGQDKAANGDKALATADAGQSATVPAGQSGEPAPLGQSGSLGATPGATTPASSAQAPGNVPAAAPATGMLSNHNGASAGAATSVTTPAATTPAFDPHARPQGDSLAAWGNAANKTAAKPATSQATQGTAKAQQAAANKPAATGPRYVFTYQMGAFKNKAAAEAMQKKLGAKGQRSAVSQNGKVWLVTCQVRGTEDQARATRLKLEQQGFGKALLTSRKAVK